jgi:putative SOS response-associated peptidase YedK
MMGVDPKRPFDPRKRHLISAADGAVLSIARLWDEWRDQQTNESVLSSTTIVTADNDITRYIDDRMPVLLGRRDHGGWLTGKDWRRALVARAK